MNNRVLTFKGTHQEIGEQVGLLYKKWGKTYSYMPPQADEYYPQQLKTYEKFYPQHLEFLTGLSKGLKINKDRIFKISLTIFISASHETAKNNCSTFAVKNKNRVFIGRNYDWRESSEKFSKVITYTFTNISSYDIVGISDMGTWKKGVSVDPSDFVLFLEDAWNEKGLYVGLNGAPGQKSGLGIVSPHIVQLIAENCTTVDSAINVIQKIPMTNSKLFILADKNGNLAVVEVSLEKGIYVRRSRDLIIATNHFNHPILIPLNSYIFDEVENDTSFPRCGYLESRLIQYNGKTSFDSIFSILGKRATLQNRRGIKNGDILTIWTLALNLSDGKYKIKFAPLLRDGLTISN